jgi:DNA-directed RNA polymerase alpha subunit
MEYIDFLNKLSKTERTALEDEGIDSFKKLAALSKKELLAKHGIGRKMLPLVNEYLNKVGMKLKD